MKNKILLSLLLISVFLALVSCKINGEKITVFADGNTEYSIVMASDADSDEKSLASRLSELSGVAPVTDESAEQKYEILIGETNRPASDKHSGDLAGLASATYFHFIIAEDDGKIVIISDNEVGYLYALEYIEKTYVENGSFVIPRGKADVQKVLWDTYYASDIYFERLTAEADKNRYESNKNQLENEMNKYEENNGNSIITLEEAIEQYKTKLASFSTPSFGDYSASIFTSANKYREPTVRPEEGAHPRILFTENSIDDVRANILSDESSKAYKKYITLSDISDERR